MIDPRAEIRYDQRCETCEGHVAERILESENLRVGRSGFATVEQAVVGVCDRCGRQKNHVSVLERAEAALRTGGSRTRSVRVAPFHTSA